MDGSSKSGGDATAHSSFREYALSSLSRQFADTAAAGEADPGEERRRTAGPIRYNRTARPWTCVYDARADHARYRARHSGQHLAAITEPVTTQTLSQAA